MFINTDVFREDAIHFMKYGRYADGDYLSDTWFEYWEERNKRVLNGYEVGGQKITGEHYLYLNYLPILKVTEKQDKNFGLHKDRKKHTRGVGDRREGFPDFWDEDYVIFHIWDICKNGVTLDDFDKLCKPVRIPLIRSLENLSGGKHALWVKPRGVGASWKGAVLPLKQQFFHSNTNSFIVADKTDYLTGDGLFSKYQSYVNKLNRYSAENKGDLVSGFKRNFSLTGQKDMIYRASRWEYDELNTKIERGKRSTVFGIPINGKPNAIRGKRGDITFEEFGSFPKISKTWNIAKEGVEEDGKVYGRMVGFGTGGDEGEGLDDLTNMALDPKSYNLIEVDNKWDENMFEPSCMFTPAYTTIGFKDKQGNSLKEEAKEFYDSKREILKVATDPTLLPAHKAEKPYNLKEALATVQGNIFPLTHIDDHLKYLQQSKVHRNIVSYGKLEKGKTGIKFTPDVDLIPYEEFPVKSKEFIKSAVCVLHKPFYVDGAVPEHMYRISVDPYRHDSSESVSIGAIHVVENPNRLTSYKGDRVVAWYNGRPDTQKEFNTVLFNLALYYNCKIAPENDEPGGIVEYAKTYRLGHLLETEFELAYDLKLKTKNPSKKPGMHIGSGKNDLRKLQGDKYIQEWLLRERGVTADGRVLYNLNFIYDIGFLKEFKKYPNGNFDRISSFRINMYYEKEFAMQEKTVKIKKVDSFLANLLSA